MLPNPNIYILENSARDIPESRLREAENSRNVLRALRSAEQLPEEGAKSRQGQRAKVRPIAVRLLGMIRG